MSFTYRQAYELIANARQSGRMPHALLITGPQSAGTHRLALALAADFDGARAETLESLRHPMCRVVRPGSKIRTITIDSIRSIDSLLTLKADAGDTKLVVILEAERMKEEAANAFLKTLEEPPPQTLIIMITEMPSALLPTLLSRCVRLELRDTESKLRLSAAQERFKPMLLKALGKMGSDVAALGLRADIQKLLTDMKLEITNRITAAVKAEAKSITEGTGDKDWEARQKDAMAAMIETEYLGERANMLELISLSLGQAVLVASHAPDVEPYAPEIAELARKHEVPELLARMRAVDALAHDLSYNVTEALALDSRLLDIIGKIDL